MRGGRIHFLSTLRGQIVVIYTLLFAVAFFFVTLSVNNLVGEFLISQRTQAQLQAVDEVSSQFAKATADQNASQLYALCVKNANEFKGRVLVLDLDGIVMADSHSLLNGRILRHVEVEDILSGNLNESYAFHKVDVSGRQNGTLFTRTEEWAVYYTVSIVYQSRSVGVLLVSVSIQDVVDLIADAVMQYTFLALGIMVVLIAVSIIVSRFISQPIAQMTEAIARMGNGEFNVRTKIRGNSEIARMAKTFDNMSEQLENVERQRQEFVANASHELKSPLSAIKILTESLLYQQGVPEETYREFLADINQQIDRLNTLLDDLLILAQSDRTNVVMRYTDEWLDTLIADCVKTLTPLAQEKEITINLPDNRLQVRCDRLKLSTALINLISNGIKYTPPGGSVTIFIESEDGWVTITVSDTGIGIPDEDRAHIFERFYRVDKARSRDTGGTGLGLAIVQQIIRLHGGEITLGPKGGVGTTFIVRLPKREAES